MIEENNFFSPESKSKQIYKREKKSLTSVVINFWVILFNNEFDFDLFNVFCNNGEQRKTQPHRADIVVRPSLIKLKL